MCRLTVCSISYVLVFFVFTTVALGIVKECDFTENRQDCSIIADPGDQIKMKCSYKEGSDSSLVADEDDTPRCFSFVNLSRNNNAKFVPLISLLPGAYGFEENMSNGITTASVFIPPVIPISMRFKCFCDQSSTNETNTNVTKNVLTVSINRSYNTKVVGCNFTGYVSKYKYIQNKNRNQRVCSVTARSTDTVALFCPSQYKIDPPNCFDEVYKYQFDNVLEVSRPSAWKKVPIQSILGNEKKMNPLGKDGRVVFSTIPENVTNQSIFMCRCVADNGEDLLLNVFLNRTFVTPGEGTLSLPEEGINKLKKWIIDAYLNNKRKNSEETNIKEDTHQDYKKEKLYNIENRYIVSKLLVGKSGFAVQLQLWFYSIHSSFVFFLGSIFQVFNII